MGIEATVCMSMMIFGLWWLCHVTRFLETVKIFLLADTSLSDGFYKYTPQPYFEIFPRVAILGVGTIATGFL
jgi:hypothetical protein